MKCFMFKGRLIDPYKVYSAREPFEVANGVAFTVNMDKDGGGTETEFFLYKKYEQAVNGYYAFIRRMKKTGSKHSYSPTATLTEVPL